MAKKTKNYNLKKPEPMDFYNVELQNDNMDIIDTELKNLNEKADSKAPITDPVFTGTPKIGEKPIATTDQIPASVTVVNALTETVPGKALDAVRGKELDGKLVEVTNKVDNLDSTAMSVSEAVKVAYGLSTDNANVDKVLQAARDLITSNINLANTKTRIATGSYTGLNGTSRIIYVGVTPKVLMVTACTLVSGDYLSRALPEDLVIGVYPTTHAATHASVSSSADYYTTSVKLQWTSTGMIISHDKPNVSPSVIMDHGNYQYSWIAFF
ncbi:hypothetical protein [Sinanaerobacter sp. ZZT-01]|uniref:hypothetical protein n=1 Tax=Sinanaerobacter sp. ZZT-01 TaxID=3111540 RepID=UPI002D76C2BD|nr:hypothetical protein [Sinanaerobacter sp. ZZT-01]WRR94082.1 hypothetical protein U5921_02890 [Sinanaerobacter sp. ZZT-01]